jgi:hypothetical protein
VSIEKLLALNVNEHTEKKNNLTYLSWAWAWAEALKADPAAIYRVEMFDGKCYMDINGTAMVWVTVTMFGKPMMCQLPVMDYRNKAIEKPDAFQVNTAIMRCLTKCLGLHGLGLYIYAGEDIPEQKPAVKIVPNQGARDDVPADELPYLEELAAEVTAMVVHQPAAAKQRIRDENLEEPQMRALWSYLDAPTRRVLKATP